MDAHTLFASVASSICSKVALYPVDTLAIRQQTGTWQPLNQGSLYRSCRALYRGLSVSLLLTTPALSLYLCTYRQAKESLLPRLGDTNLLYAVSGTCAEVISSVLWTPLEVIKARCQVSSEQGIWRQCRGLASEGWRGFYKGYGMGLLIFIPYNAIWWSTYENVKVSVGGGIVGQAAMGSMVASSVATVFGHPLDLLKTRYQVSTSESISNIVAKESSPVPANIISGNQKHGSANRGSDKLGIRYVFRNVVRESGYRGLYAGFGIRLLCSVPGSVIAMMVFEYVKPDFNESSKQGS